MPPWLQLKPGGRHAEDEGASFARGMPVFSLQSVLRHTSLASNGAGVKVHQSPESPREAALSLEMGFGMKPQLKLRQEAMLRPGESRLNP